MDQQELPYWLISIGATLVVIGISGVLANRKPAAKADAMPDKQVQTPSAQMPPLPKPLDSGGKGGIRK